MRGWGLVKDIRAIKEGEERVIQKVCESHDLKKGTATLETRKIEG